MPRSDAGCLSVFIIVVFPVVPFVAPYHLLFQGGALFATFFELALFPDPFRLIFIAAAMALCTVLIVIDALFQVLFADLGAGVFMAAVAGVACIVAVHVTGAALGIVVTVEAEVVTVVEGGRQPGLVGMAFVAVVFDLLVQGIARPAVATVALFPRRHL